MALTEFPAPNSLPTNQNDYVKQNDQREALILDIDKTNPVEFEDDVINQGTVLNLGGVLLVAETDESISGTKSNYVKVDMSTYTAEYVTDLTGVTWNPAYNGYYDSSGNLYLFNEVKAYGQAVIEKVYQKTSVAAISSNKYIDCEFYEQGINLKITGGYDLSNANGAKLSDDRIVVYAPSSRRILVYEFDGLSWDLKDAFQPSATCGNGDVAVLSSTRIAWIDQTDQLLTTYDYLGDGSGWSIVGSQLSVTYGSRVITELSSTRIALSDNTAQELRVYDFNGSTWSVVGTPYTPPSLYIESMDSIDGSTIIGRYLDELYILSFNGTTWSQTGNTGTLPISSSLGGVLALSDNEFVVGIAYTSVDILISYTFDGTDFIVSTGNPFVTSIYSITSIFSFSSSRFIVLDDLSSNDTIRSFRRIYI